ncbi:MAG: hypothetical protein K2Z81_11510, partial [Cyanobacteria bacterium]|nr:hypothetical protein [Cyanobacteriota bacterium]
AALLSFERTLDFIRMQASEIHFNGRADLKAIDNRMKNIRIEVGSETYPNASLRLPALHAKIEGDDDDALLKVVEDTVLLQFSIFVGQAHDRSDETIFARCEGIFREESAEAIFPVHEFPLDVELKWRQEIPVLVEQNLEQTPEIQRCADFFIPKGRARFCSDDCRFRTFQLVKQLTDPKYLANKQRRYRQKKDSGS